MVEFGNILTTGPIPQQKAIAGFATGAIMLAIFCVLLGAQLMFAVLEPATLAAAAPQAPLGVIGP